jgi:hypothetical protein
MTVFNASLMFHPVCRVSDSLTSTIVPDVGSGGVGIYTFSNFSFLCFVSIIIPVTNPIVHYNIAWPNET